MLHQRNPIYIFLSAVRRPGTPASAEAGLSGTKEKERNEGLPGPGQTAGRAVSTGRSMSAAAIR